MPASWITVTATTPQYSYGMVLGEYNGSLFLNWNQGTKDWGDFTVQSWVSGSYQYVRVSASRAGKVHAAYHNGNTAQWYDIDAVQGTRLSIDFYINYGPFFAYYED